MMRDPRDLRRSLRLADRALVRADRRLDVDLRLGRRPAVPQVPARAAAASRPTSRWHRVGRTAWIVLTHAWIKRRDGVAGLAHALIFYGFVVLFIGTAILAFQDDFAEPVLGWDFWHGPFYLGYSLFLDVFGARLIVGLVIMAVKRERQAGPARLRPRRRGHEPLRALALPGRRLGLRRLAPVPRRHGLLPRSPADRGDRSLVREVVAGRLARRPGPDRDRRRRVDCVGSALPRPGGCTASRRLRSSRRSRSRRRCTC